MKGIIFDLDGVIVFTDEYHYLAWKTIFDKYNISFNREMNKLLRGVSRSESLEIVLKENKLSLNKETKLKILDEKNNLYVEYLKNKLDKKALNIDCEITLKVLKEKGYKLAIGSSSKNAKLILEKIGMLNYFDAISDGTIIKNSKPDPEVFLLAAKLLHLSANECYVVEDGEAGIIAANKGGFKAIGIGNEISNILKFTKIETFSQLSELL